MAKLTLKGARANVGLSQKKAAKELKISNTTLCSWEKGKSMPNVQQVQDICALYGVSYDDLIFLPTNPLKAEYEK